MTRPFRVRIPVEVYVSGCAFGPDYRPTPGDFRPDYAELDVEASDATDAASKVAKAIEWLVAGKRDG